MALAFITALFVSCTSTKVLYNGNTDAEVRDNLSELQNQQSESAGASERIAAASGNIELGLQDIKNELGERAEENADFEQVLERIREQKLTE